MFVSRDVFRDEEDDDELPPGGRDGGRGGGGYGRHAGGGGRGGGSSDGPGGFTSGRGRPAGSPGRRTSGGWAGGDRDDDDDRPRTGSTGSGAYGAAGALPATESRKAVMDRQREIERQKAAARRMGGPGVMRAGGFGDGGPGSPARDPMRTPGIRQFSAPRAEESTDPFGDSDPEGDDDEERPRPMAMPSAVARADRGRDDRGGTGGFMSGGGGGRGSMSGGGGGRGPEEDVGDDGSAIKAVIRERERKRTESKTSERATGAARDMAMHGVAATFDPTEGGGGGGGKGGADEGGDHGGGGDTSDLDFSDMRHFLTEPTPRSVGVVQCYIDRNKSGMNKLFPVYLLYMKDGDRFLLAGKKRPKQKTSNYLISMDKRDLSRTSTSFLGKLRSNFVGTEFTVFDDGVNPKEGEEKGGDDAAKGKQTRTELAVVTYASNVLGSRGPRKMKVCVPKVRHGERVVFRPTAKDEAMIARFKEETSDDLVFMINKPPRWNDQVGAYVLNFNGRVTMASVKNFQLVSPDDQDRVLLQFGRVGKDRFTMDYQWPLCPLQAFAICLSSFDYKLACE